MSCIPARINRLAAGLRRAILMALVAVVAGACGPAGELFELGGALGAALGTRPNEVHLENRTQLTLRFENVPAEAMDATGAAGFAKRAAEFVRDNWDGADALERIVVEVASSSVTGIASSASTVQFFYFSMDELRAEAPEQPVNVEAPGTTESGDTGG